MLLTSDGLVVLYFSFGARDAALCIAGVHLLVVLPRVRSGGDLASHCR